ncbi:MAG: DegV family protein [Solirubrobacterales bacterium]|nr:DegV family protein [Solirubrobacterales bacterium]
MPTAIVTDTCHYLPQELVREWGIHEVSLYVHKDGVATREADIADYDNYYHELADLAKLPSTSQPSVGDFLAVYEPLIESGHDIISIHLSGGISGTVDSAQQAREALGENAGRVHVLDSGSACGAQGMIVLVAAKTVQRGGDFEAVVARTNETREALRMWFAVDTLEYLKRGGRIGGAQAWLATALKIKPILQIGEQIEPFERVRTSKRAFERLVSLLEEARSQGYDGWAVQHIQAPVEAQALAQEGRRIFGRDPLLLSEIGPVIGTHVGPGLLGAGVIPTALVS